MKNDALVPNEALWELALQAMPDSAPVLAEAIAGKAGSQTVLGFARIQSEP